MRNFHVTFMFLCVLNCGLLRVAVAAEEGKAESAVTLSETPDTYTLQNGIVIARINKDSGGLVSLEYHGTQLLHGDARHPGGYWSHAPAGKRVTDTLTIDPKTNSGMRAEVSIKGLSNEEAMGRGPGGSTIADLEIRYALGKGDSGVYTYSIFNHPSSYPATSVGEARFALKLNPKVFDWMTIDANRNKQMATPEDWDAGTQLNMKEARRLTTGIYKGQVEHKYDYSAVQFDIPAFGWSSTHDHVGLWIVNPTIEYLSGGATKVELTGHLDINPGAVPTLLNYWRGSHYGGSQCNIASGEAWTKVIGPFLIYCNAGASPDAAWKDALAQAKTEAGRWPYEWVEGVDYPHKNQRGLVWGKIVLHDPQAAAAHLSHALVGLAWPDTPSRASGRDASLGGGIVDWQQDAKHYEFWTRVSDDGHFSIPSVRPGTYTLHAISDGVLGEYAQANVKVAGGSIAEFRRDRMEAGPFWKATLGDRYSRSHRQRISAWRSLLAMGLVQRVPERFSQRCEFHSRQKRFSQGLELRTAPPRRESDDMDDSLQSFRSAQGRGDFEACAGVKQHPHD